MKYLKIYKIYEAAKVKKNWLEITQSKLKEFKQMINNNPVIQNWNNDEVIKELINELQDVVGNEFKINYKEYIQFFCDNEKMNTLLTNNGEIRSDFPIGYTDRTQNPYMTYSEITKWLDRKRSSGKDIDVYYAVYIEPDFMNTRDVAKRERIFTKTEKGKEYLKTIKASKEFLESLGFKIEFVNSWTVSKLSFVATIKLSKTEEIKNKTLDLSDIVPSNIVDDFEKFILRRNLTRSDAEEIANIFIKKD